MKKLLLLLLVVSMLSALVLAPVVSAAPNKDVDNANKFLKAKFNVNAEQNFKTMKVTKDDLGLTHVKMQQIVDGMPVFGKQYIVHFDANNNVYTTSGDFDKKAMNYKKGDFIKAKEAIEIAKNDVGYTAGVNVNQEDIFTTELNLYNVAEEYIPVYVVEVNWLHEDSFGGWDVIVDAVSGKVVKKYDKIETGKPAPALPVGTNVTGTGIGVLGDSKTLNILLSNGTYYLLDYTRATKGIITYDSANKTRLPGTLISDANAVWDTAYQAAGVDAHNYIERTYDYFKVKFNRNSLDNLGMAMKSSVHYSTDYVNAFWNGTQMVFGDGDGVMSLALSGGFDIVAHELTHGINSFEADLIYADQSGALSESMSDVMATAAEYYVQPTMFDWQVGEDVWTPAISGDALRSLEDPTLYGDPAVMADYVVTTADNGGVHTNCGIPNHAAYHIGSVIGPDKMGAIFYRSLTTYLTASATFTQFRVACLQSATDLYGASSTEYNAVVNAFNIVGIY